MILKNKRDSPSLGTAQVLDKKHLKKRSTKLLKAYHLMKNLLIIFSVLLSTPLYGQISPDGTGIVNGVYIGPNSILEMGINIGDKAVIGAMSFVNQDIPHSHKFYGNKLIKQN